MRQWVLKNGFFLGLLDMVTRVLNGNGTSQKKLLLAATIIECSPLSADWLLPKKNHA